MRQANPVLLNQLRADYEAIKAQGASRLMSQGMISPRGFEDVRFLIKNSMRPIVSHGDPAQVQYSGGFTGIVAGTVNTAYEGTMQMIVTEAGHDQFFAEWVHANKGIVDMDYYDGRVDGYTRAYELLNAAIRFDQAEFDTESRSNVMTISMPCTYNYFGSFASVGANNTVQPGQIEIAGTSDLIGRVQNVLNTAQQALNIGRQVQSLGNQVGALFG